MRIIAHHPLILTLNLNLIAKHHVNSLEKYLRECPHFWASLKKWLTKYSKNGLRLRKKTAQTLNAKSSLIPP